MPKDKHVYFIELNTDLVGTTEFITPHDDFETYADYFNSENIEIEEIDSDINEILSTHQPPLGKWYIFKYFFISSCASIFIGALFKSSLALLISFLAIIYMALKKYFGKNHPKIVFEYSLDKKAEKLYAGLVDQLEGCKISESLWYVFAGEQDATYRSPLRTTQNKPYFMSVNYPVVCFEYKKTRGSVEFVSSIYFLPDRIISESRKKRLLFFETKSYIQFRLDESIPDLLEMEYIESEKKPPKDARVVGSTWQHANKDGSPDKRFSKNKKTPVCLYDLIEFHKLMTIMTSSADIFPNLKIAFDEYIDYLRDCCIARDEPPEADQSNGQ